MIIIIIIIIYLYLYNPSVLPLLQGPTTHYQKLEPHYKSASIIFHFPATDSKRRAYQVSFEKSPLTWTTQVTKGLPAIFQALTSNPVLKRKKSWKVKAKARTMASDFDCNLKLGEHLIVGVETWQIRSGTLSIWWLYSFGQDHGMLPPFQRFYDGGFVSGLTIVVVSGGCVW